MAKKASKKVVRRSTPLIFAKPGVERIFREFVVKSSPHDTYVSIEIELHRLIDGKHVRAETAIGDGLVPPNQIRWQGQMHDLPQQCWKLIDILEHTKEKRLPVRDVFRAIWPNSDGDDGDLKRLISKTTKALIEIDHWFIVRRESGFVILD